MKQTWFNKTGWHYIPVHFYGSDHNPCRYRFYDGGMYGGIQRWSFYKR